MICPECTVPGMQDVDAEIWLNTLYFRWDPAVVARRLAAQQSRDGEVIYAGRVLRTRGIKPQRLWKMSAIARTWRG